MDKLHDVMLFGAREDQDPEEVAQRISATFRIPLDEARRLIRSGQPQIFRESVSREESERYQRLLAQTGARVNAKPSLASGMALELVPMDKPHHVCPGCGHRTEYEEGEQPPSICPECGLVLDKYRKVQQQKDEAEAIRDRLEKIQSMREETDAKRLQEEEEERRRRLLEEEIRKQMGIPAVVNRPWKLWSSAAATLVLGIGLGALGGHLFFGAPAPLDGSGTLLAEQPEESLEQMIADMSSEMPGGPGAVEMSLEEETKAQEQMLALSHAVLEQTEITGGSTSVSAPGDRDDDPALGTVGGVKPEALALADEEDAEWQWLIDGSIQTKLNAGETAGAEALASHLSDHRMHYVARARVAASYARRHQASEAKRVISAMVASLSKEPSAPLRLEGLVAIAPVLAEAGLKTTAAHLMSQAESAAAETADAGDRSLAWTQIALAHADMGDTEASQIDIAKASEGLKTPMAATRRIQVATRLAEVFSRLGARDNAVKILNRAQRSVGGLEGLEERDGLIELVSNGWADIGDLERALAASEQMSTTQGRDRHLVSMIEDRGFSGDYFGLPSVAESIASASARARAFGLLGLSSPDQRAAGDYFERAIKESAGIEGGLAQVGVRSEIARMMTRTSHEARGTAVFASTQQALLQRGAGGERDLGLASLAKHRARAFQTAEAAACVKLLQNESLRSTVERDLQQVSQILSQMRGVSEPRTS